MDLICRECYNADNNTFTFNWDSIGKGGGSGCTFGCQKRKLEKFNEEELQPSSESGPEVQQPTGSDLSPDTQQQLLEVVAAPGQPAMVETKEQQMLAPESNLGAQQQPPEEHEKALDLGPKQQTPAKVEESRPEADKEEGPVAEQTSATKATLGLRTEEQQAEERRQIVVLARLAEKSGSPDRHELVSRDLIEPWPQDPSKERADF